VIETGTSAPPKRNDRRRPQIGWLGETAITVVLINILHAFDLVAPGGHIWLFNVAVAAGALCQRPLVRRWLGGTGSPTTAQMWAASALLVGLSGVATYLTGWGPLACMGFVVLTMTMIEGYTSRIWVPIATFTVAACALGLAGVALGWAPSYLPLRAALLIGPINLVGVVLAIRIIGQVSAAREREAAAREREAAAREREAAERASAEERFRALVQDSNDVIAIVGQDGKISYVSPAVEHVLGYAPDDYVGVIRGDLIHPADGAVAAAMGQAFQDGVSQQHVELRIRHADGSYRWHEVHARDLRHHPAVAGVVFNHRDITERRNYQEKLAHEASHDALTGLANRSALRTAVATACAGPAPVALLYLDLDGFKQTNDRFGHDAGDALLVATAQVLRDCVPGAGTASRLGGDEFAVVLDEVGTLDGAIAVARRITDRLAEPILFGGHRLTANASIGIALCGSGQDPAEAIGRADAAMYRAKRDGLHRWRCDSEDAETGDPLMATR
jgi:diguanylate cyclase (GGDEF)-like protein/PAS domain S-box-containing protein